MRVEIESQLDLFPSKLTLFEDLEIPIEQVQRDVESMMVSFRDSSLEKQMSKSYNNFLVDLLKKFKEKCDELNEEIRTNRETNHDINNYEMSFVSVDQYNLDNDYQESSEIEQIPILYDNTEIEINNIQTIIQQFGQTLQDAIQQKQFQPQNQQSLMNCQIKLEEETNENTPEIKNVKYLNIDKDLKIKGLKFSDYDREDFKSLRVLYHDYFSHGMWYFTNQNRLEILYLDREGYFLRSEVFKNFKLKDKLCFGFVEMKTYDPDRVKDFELVLFLGQSKSLQRDDVFEYYSVREDKYSRHEIKNVKVYSEEKEEKDDIISSDQQNEEIKEVQLDKSLSQDSEDIIDDEFTFSEFSIPVVFQQSRLIILEENCNLENELMGTIYDIAIESDEVQMIMKSPSLSYINIKEYTPLIWDDYLILLFGQEATGSYFQSQKLSLEHVNKNVFSLDLWLEDDINQQFLVNYPYNFVIRSPLIFKDEDSNKWYMICKVFGVGKNFSDAVVNNRKIENIGHVFEIRIENLVGTNIPHKFIMKTIPDMQYFGINPIKDDQRLLEQLTFNQRLNSSYYNQEMNIWFLVDMTTTVYILDLHNKVFSQGSTMKELPI
eukprot:403373215